MERRFELVCKSLGLVLSAAGLVLGAGVLCRLLRPAPAWSPFLEKLQSQPGGKEALGLFQDSFNAVYSPSFAQVLPDLVGWGLCPLFLGLLLMRMSGLVVRYACPGQPQPEAPPAGNLAAEAAAPPPPAPPPEAPRAARGRGGQEKYAPPGFYT